MSVISEEKVQNQNHDVAEFDGGDAVLVPPFNFSKVDEGIYRSGIPEPHNFAFLQTLNLKSIVYLCPEPYPEELCKFMESHNIKLYQIGAPRMPEPHMKMPSDLTTKALQVIVDVQNQPVLIHCKRGKTRTGCVLGCLRKMQNWPLSRVIDEYKHFAGEKVRPSDITFIEEYDLVNIEQAMAAQARD